MIARSLSLLALAVVAAFAPGPGASAQRASTQAPSQQARAMPPAEGEAGEAALNPLRALSKSQLKAFIEQPLFDPTRRLPPPMAPPPAPVQMPVAAAPPAPPPDIHLVGFIYSDNSVAILRLSEGGETLRVHSGENVAEWKATVLPDNALRLAKGDREVVFKLFKTHGTSNLMPDGSIPGSGYGLEHTMMRRNERLKNRQY